MPRRITTQEVQSGFEPNHRTQPQISEGIGKRYPATAMRVKKTPIAFPIRKPKCRVEKIGDNGKRYANSDKRGYRTSEVLVRQMSGNPTYQEFAAWPSTRSLVIRICRQRLTHGFKQIGSDNNFRVGDNTLGIMLELAPDPD